MGRGKGDDTDLSYYLKGKGWNYRGRPKARDHKLYREAFAIVNNETLPQWENLGIPYWDYVALRNSTIMKRFNVTPQEDETLRSFSPEAERQIRVEVGTLVRVLISFLLRVDKAKEENDQGFISIVREVFGEESDDILGPDAPRKGKGRKVKRSSIYKAYDTFLKWVTNDTREELPKTFYEREKPRGLCVLAHEIHQIIWQPIRIQKIKIKKLRAAEKVSLLIEKYDLTPGDVFPKVSTTNEPHKTIRPGRKPSDSEPILKWLARRQEIDRRLKELEDI